VEASFYLLFPLIIRRIMALKPAAVLPVFLTLFLGSQGLFWTLRTAVWGEFYYTNAVIHHVLLYHPLVYYPVFILGVLAFRLEQAWHRSGESRPHGMALLTLVSALAITLLSYWAGEYLTYGIHAGMLAPVYGVLIYSLCEERNWVARLLSGRGFSELGEASYSVYILQMPVFGLLAMFHSGPKDGAFFYVYLAVLVVLSWGLYRWYETPIRMAIRRKWG
jgi:peptidoglycan/LPS O-acetylase OafA/YrhL